MPIKDGTLLKKVCTVEHCLVQLEEIITDSDIVDTGSCGSPEIEFGAGFDGRKENSFAPVNTADFNHGSALKPAVITSFICGQLASKCKADQATVDACNEGAAAANAASGQAAVDAFNAALGV